MRIKLGSDPLWFAPLGFMCIQLARQPKQTWPRSRTPRKPHPFPSSAPAPTHNPFSKTFKLNTGDSIPAIGLGTWQSQPGDVGKAVEAALRHGYRHIDGAFAYGNEKEVGEGIRASGVPRGDIWLTTKLDNPWHKRVAEAIDRSLANLGTEYVDLYLMHWPASLDPADHKKVYPDWDFVDTWREMQKLVGTGKVKNIGVSNFAIKNLERLLNDPSCKVGLAGFGGKLFRTVLTVGRSSPPSIRSSCTPGTRPPSSSPTAPPRASTARAIHPSAAATRLCTATTRLRPLQRPRTAASSR